MSWTLLGSVQANNCSKSESFELTMDPFTIPVVSLFLQIKRPYLVEFLYFSILCFAPAFLSYSYAFPIPPLFLSCESKEP